MVSTYPPLPHPVTIHVPDRAPRDQTMGEYMDACSRMESLLRSCIREMMNVDEMIVRPVFAALMTKQTIDLLAATAKANLTAKGASEVTSLPNASWTATGAETTSCTGFG